LDVACRTELGRDYAAELTKGRPGSVSALITPECSWYAVRLRLL